MRKKGERGFVSEKHEPRKLRARAVAMRHIADNAEDPDKASRVRALADRLDETAAALEAPARAV